MSNTVIKVEGLSKRYQLGTIGYGSLQHDLRAWWARASGKEDPNSQIGQKSRLDQHGEFWALRDIGFEVQQGDRVGIIGKNGAGKSTLLKLLSRVTGPTTGRISVRGRIASLLEVGTGFHPELTGRENVFLNGAILGMKRREIQAKFDEIVEFAGVNQFIDTPVKRYSSGMYVRLAFSVAAHLDSEILIVDEVLAVGDAEFQQKCLGKMEDISKGHGRTILFVSHQMSALQALCNQGLVLSQGRVDMAGKMEDAVLWYNKDLKPKLDLSPRWIAEPDFFGDDAFQPRELYCINDAGAVVDSAIKMNETVTVCLKSWVKEKASLLSFGIVVSPLEGDQRPLFWSCFTDGPLDNWPLVDTGENVHHCEIPPRFLNEGMYRVELVAFLHMKKWILSPNDNGPAISLEIRGGFGTAPYWYERREGPLAPLLKWRRA